MRTHRRGFLRGLGGSLAWALGRPSRAAADSGALRLHRATRNTRLGALGARLPRLSSPLPPFKTYPDAPVVPLPAPEEVSGPSLARCLEHGGAEASFAGEPVAREELGRLLHLTNGITGSLQGSDPPFALRAAPSAGALYAGEVYVVAERVRGLAPGVYYYAVAQHALLELAKGPHLDRVTAATEWSGELEGAALAILLTNVFGRYTWRYAARGYRYALIDTGHIGENLRLASIAAGLVERDVPRFHDDALNALLGLDGVREAVCALRAVGRPGDGPRAGVAGVVLVEGGREPVLERSATEPERYHEATKLVPSSEGAPAAPRAPSASEAVSRPGRSARAPTMALGRAIRERRSPLAFASRPVPRGALAFALEAARGHPQLVRAEVDVYAVVHRVRGLPPGLYRFAAPTRLEPSGRDRGPAALVKACLGQEMAGTAAVGFALVARLGEAAQRGDRSYRELLIEAGAIAQRLYLAAVSWGLAARNLAAFIDDDLDALLGLDGAEQAVVHLTMFGRGR